MKPALRLLLLILLFHLSYSVSAQDRYQLTGTVVNEKNEPVVGAAVFLSGSKRAMATDATGRFSFAEVPPAAYKLVVKMLGYAPFSRELTTANTTINVNIKLQPKPISLKEVAIGNNRSWYQNFELFKQKFLGRSANARACVILNPAVLNFSTRKDVLMADADDFLVIENKRLGYRIHYLLQQFEHNYSNNISQYSGEFSFEELEGNNGQQTMWAKNRAKTYQGSFMQFLRTVYAGSCIENGFLVRQFLDYGTIKGDSLTKDTYKLVVIDSALNVENLTSVINSNFKSFAFDQLYVIHDFKKATNYKYAKPATTLIMEHPKIQVIKKPTTIVRDLDASTLRLNTKDAVIDKQGSYVNHHNFFIKGKWGEARMGDELPVDYMPPVADKPKEKRLLKDELDKFIQNHY